MTGERSVKFSQYDSFTTRSPRWQLCIVNPMLLSNDESKNTTGKTRLTKQSDSKASNLKLSLINYISSGLFRLEARFHLDNLLLKANDCTDTQV